MLEETTPLQFTDGAQRRNQIRFSRICFTVHGTDEELEDASKNLKKLTPKWMIFGHETCPKTLRRHLQGAIVFGRQIQFSTIKKIAGLERAHLEPMRGTPEQNLVYCTKEDPDAYQYGTMPHQGKRNDLHAAIELLKAGKTTSDLISQPDVSLIATFVRYPKGLQLISQTFRRSAKQPPCVLWLHGSTGTGKTRLAHAIAEYMGCTDRFWISNGALQWFDGYDGQPVVCIDDYRTDHAKFSAMLRLLDRYYYSVPVKGAFVDWQPLLIIITAPKSPRNMWNLRTEEDLKQLERRIHYTFDTDEYADYADLYADVFSTLKEKEVSDRYTELAKYLIEHKDDGKSDDNVEEKGSDSEATLSL